MLLVVSIASIFLHGLASHGMVSGDYPPQILIQTPSSLILKFESYDAIESLKLPITLAMLLCPTRPDVAVENVIIENSYSKKVLFPKETVKTVDDLKEKWQSTKCKNRIQTAKKFGSEKQSLDIGYEICFEKSSIERVHPSQSFFHRTWTTTMKKPLEKMGILQHPLENYNCIWITVFTMSLNSKELQATYEMVISGSPWGTTQEVDCMAVDEDNCVEKSRKLDALKEENQYQLTNSPSMKENQLEMHQLVPSDHFNSVAQQNATAFHENNIFLRSSIATTSWSFVNEFIKDLAKVLGRLQIITGSYGKLEMPLLFYKLVKFEYKSQLYGEDIQFAILVIIYTNIFENPSSIHESCSFEFCVKNKWWIGNKDLQNGLTHCCPVSDELLNILKVKNFPKIYTDFDIQKVEETIEGYNRSLFTKFEHYLPSLDS